MSIGFLKMYRERSKAAIIIITDASLAICSFVLFGRRYFSFIASSLINFLSLELFIFCRLSFFY